MGLTIHYKLTADRSDEQSIRSIVRDIHKLAKDLPFQEVGDVVEFQGEECRYDNQDDLHRWLKIQSGQYLDSGVHVLPLHVMAFTTFPGEGCEPANIGLARYPASVEVEKRGVKKKLTTQLQGWSWSSFCKTQYASDPAAGGVANFVRCHLCVVHLLDAIQKRRLAQVEVSDEGDYWEQRDVRKLAETVGEWNQMIAAVVGQFKDGAPGMKVEAPITEFADFEHLEAKGRDKFDKPS